MATVARYPTTSTGNGSRHSAYREAVRLEIREVTRRLNTALGGTMVSALAGSADPKSSHKWANENGPAPRAETARRLYFAYEQWQQVAEAEGEHIARVWFIGANPWLGYDTPVNAIRENRFPDVADAAHALVDDAFSG